MAAETNRRRGLVGGLGTNLGSKIWERRQIISANKSFVVFAALPYFCPDDLRDDVQTTGFDRETARSQCNNKVSC